MLRGEHLIVDIETAGHPCAVDFIEAPDLAAIQPAKNLKDPAKIAEDVARRKADAVAEYENKLARAALDWNVSRIVAMGWSIDGGETVTTRSCLDEMGEYAALDAFWEVATGRVLVGFSIRTFDAPTLIQRSLLLKVPYFRRLSLNRWNNASLVDLRDVLTFDDARYEALMPRSLKAFCRRFGIPVTDEIEGSQIGQLVADGKWDEVIAHVTSDVKLTAALAQRIGVLQTVQQQTADIF